MATPYDAPVPGAVGQMNLALLGKTAYDNTMARINQQRGQTLQQYGYLGDVDPTSGVLANVRVDPHSMYGDFQSMLRNHAGLAQQAEFANQDRGLRGGMANKALSDLHYGFGQESAELGTKFAHQFTDFQDQQTQARYEYDKALYEQQLADAQAAIANQNFNPAGDGGDGGDGGGTDGGGDTGGGDTGGGDTGGGIQYPDPYTAAAAEAIANGYTGYVHAPGGGPAKPSKKRVAKTTKKVTSGGWVQVK